MLYKPWDPGVVPPNQPCYQLGQDCTYWLVLDIFNNWNIIIFNNRNTTSEEFEAIHQVLIDVISDNMASLVQSVNYDAMNKIYHIKMGY